jgi:uncharacterized protein (DUF2249 family)/hemerythrin-like domain-containing protein
MNALVIASTEADARAAASIEEHHARLGGALQMQAEAVLAAAAGRHDGAWREATGRLVSWCRAELLPHAAAEEQTLYAAAHDRAEGRLLVDSMLREHELIASLVEELASADEPVAAAAAAKALQVVVASHIEKENAVLLPLLSSAAEVSLAALLESMHECVTRQDPEASAAHGDGQDCTCGETDSAAYPELDARAVPHAIRHATVFGALDGIRPGGGLVLVAPHDPRPLLAQVERRNPGVFSVEYLERGPEAWRLSFVRASA